MIVKWKMFCRSNGNDKFKWMNLNGINMLCCASLAITLIAFCFSQLYDSELVETLTHPIEVNVDYRSYV